MYILYFFSKCNNQAFSVQWRDLLKFCKRVESLLSCSGHESITSYVCENICKEVRHTMITLQFVCMSRAFVNDTVINLLLPFQAIDVFASFSTSAANRLAIMREIARLWGVVGAETLYPVSKPVIQVLLIVMWFHMAIYMMCISVGCGSVVVYTALPLFCTMFRNWNPSSSLGDVTFNMLKWQWVTTLFSLVCLILRSFRKFC